MDGIYFDTNCNFTSKNVVKKCIITKESEILVENIDIYKKVINFLKNVIVSLETCIFIRI